MEFRIDNLKEEEAEYIGEKSMGLFQKRLMLIQKNSFLKSRMKTARSSVDV